MMARTTRVAAAIAALILMESAMAAERTYHVATTGIDANAGGEAKPFRTIQHAADLMRAGDTCIVHAGTYRETVTVKTSGAEGKPIRFTAAAGEEVILDGTEPIQGAWEVHEGAICRTTVDRAFEQLFVDGRMMIEARWPSIRFREIFARKGWRKTGKGSRYGTIVDPGLAKTGIDWTGALATLNVAHQFFTWSRRVTKHAVGADTFTYPKNLPVITHYANNTRPWEQNQYYLSGSPGALDQPGEWFLDEKTKTLSLWTLDGDDPSKHAVTAKARTYGFEAEGVKHVELSGFRFFGCTFRFGGCDHCVIDDCHLLFPTYTRDLTDLGAPVKPTPSTFVSGDHNSVRGSSLAFASGHGLTVLGSHNLVEECLVRDVCWNGSLKYVGIRLGPMPGREAEGQSVVRRCTVFNGGNTLVSVGHMPKMTVAYCHIHDGGKACKDVSLLYTQLPLIEGTVFHHNWVHGCRAPHIALGIRGDDQTRGLTVHHNVVWDCGWVGIVVKGDRNRVHHNTCFRNGKADIIMRDRPEPRKPWRKKQWPLLKVQNANSEAFNNVGRRMTSGLWGGPPLKCRTGTNYTGRAPMLADPKAGDFRPRDGSPLIDAGTPVEGFTGPFVGKAPDIGACEHGAVPWTPGVTWPEEKRTRINAAIERVMW